MSGAQVKAKQKSNLRVEQELCKQWESGKYCDAIFRVGDEVIHAHRCVLAAASKYFDTMFTSDFKDKNDAEIDLTDTFGSFDVLKDLIGFIYGNDVTIQEGNVEDLLRGSDIMGMNSLVEFCMRFLLENLCMQNCLWTWSLAVTYNLPEVAETCKDLAICRFHDTLISLDETLLLPPDHLLTFLNEGMALHCKFDQLRSFLQRYIAYDEKHLEVYKAQLATAAKLQEKETVPKKDDKSEERDLPVELSVQIQEDPDEETVLIQMTNLETWALYRPSKDQWFTAQSDSSKLQEGDSIGAIGIGTEEDHMFVIKNAGSDTPTWSLINIVTGEKKCIPTLPEVMEESGTTERKIIQATPVCSRGALGHVVLSKTTVQNDNDQTNSRESFYECYMVRYDMDKSKWRFANSIRKFKKKVVHMKVLHFSCDILYILMVRVGEMALSKYNFVDYSVEDKVPYTKNVELANQTALKCFGNEDCLIVLDKSKSILYDYKKNMWNVQDEMDMLPPGDERRSKIGNLGEIIIRQGVKLVALSDKSGMSYFIAGENTRLTRFKSFRILDGTVTELNPYPCVQNTGLRSEVIRVSKETLSKLLPFNMISFLNEKVCLVPQEIEERVTEYKKRIKKTTRPEKEGDDKAEGITDEEVFQHFMHNMLAHQTLLREQLEMDDD